MYVDGPVTFNRQTDRIFFSPPGIYNRIPAGLPGLRMRRQYGVQGEAAVVGASACSHSPRHSTRCCSSCRPCARGSTHFVHYSKGRHKTRNYPPLTHFVNKFLILNFCNFIFKKKKRRRRIFFFFFPFKVLGNHL